MWTGARSTTERPVTQPRPIGQLVRSITMGPWCALTLSCSPCRRKMTQSYASHNCVADLTNVSSTV